MKHIKQKQAQKVQNSQHCWVYEYPSDSKEINGAFVEMTGREPDAGRVVNIVCKELAYVIEGSGKIVIEGTELSLEKGDMVLIEPGEKFYWDGDMTLFLSCSPAWYLEQYKKTE